MSARYQFYTLSVPATTGTSPGDAHNVKIMDREKAVYLEWTSGAFQVQVSADGTNFVNYGSSFGASGVLTLPFAVLAVRVACTSNGTAVAQVAGFQA